MSRRRRTSHPHHIKAALIMVVMLLTAIAALITSVALSGANLSGINRAASFSEAPETEFRRVFVTSTTYTGNLGGLTGADAKCQQRADAVGLGGAWKAWLSDSTTSAASRLEHFNGPYKLINGLTIAANWDDLTDGHLNTLPWMTERGTIATEFVWTNTNPNGTTYSPTYYHCFNWRAGTSWEFGGQGRPNRYNSEWTVGLHYQCHYNYHLYCFEQAPPATPTPTPVITACEADLSNNGVVDEDDVDVLRDYFGKDCTQGGCQGDFNDDGIVDILDFSLMRSVMGEECLN